MLLLFFCSFSCRKSDTDDVRSGVAARVSCLTHRGRATCPFAQVAAWPASPPGISGQITCCDAADDPFFIGIQPTWAFPVSTMRLCRATLCYIFYVFVECRKILILEFRNNNDQICSFFFHLYLCICEYFYGACIGGP